MPSTAGRNSTPCRATSWWASAHALGSEAATIHLATTESGTGSRRR
jgi:hypothetical protein